MSGGGIFDVKGRLVAITLSILIRFKLILYYESGEAVGKEDSDLIAKYSMGISSSRLSQYLVSQESPKQSFKSTQCS